MCQYEICGCEPVESGRLGPRVSTIVDRRVRPSVRLPDDRRGAAEPAADPWRDAGDDRELWDLPAAGTERAGSLV